MAVTALVLGGANLAGGRGSAFGSLLGALNIYLITYVLSTFNFGMVQSFVTDLAYGVMLVVSLLISVALPQIQQRFRNLSPLMFFFVLAVIALGVIMHTSMDQTLEPLVGTSASSMMLGSSASSAAAEAAGAGSYSAGTYILFVIIGAVAVVTVFRLLFKYPSPPMIAFTVLLAVGTLGLIFSPSPPINNPADSTTEVAATSADERPELYTPNFFVMETVSSPTGANGPLVKTTQIIVTVIGTVLLASLIILLMLPHVTPRTKRIALFMFAGVVATVAIGALFFDSFDQGYLTSTLSREMYAIILVGVALFTLSAPLVHTHFKNISHVFITLLGVLALICVYFFSGPNRPHKDDTPLAAQTVYAAPIFKTGVDTVPAASIVYEKPVRINVDVSQMSTYSKISYSAFIIVLLHVFLYIAMGKASFKRFWRHWHIPVFGGLLWSGLFYAIGVPLWHIVAIIGIAILSAPNVMHIISTYLVKQRRDISISQWSG